MKVVKDGLLSSEMVVAKKTGPDLGHGHGQDHQNQSPSNNKMSLKEVVQNGLKSLKNTIQTKNNLI